MSDIRRTQQWHTYVRSPAPVSGGLTAYQVRDFVHALDSAGVPDSAAITAHHANDTRHLIGLSVHVVDAVDLDHPTEEGTP